jgi:hypothetical protein
MVAMMMKRCREWVEVEFRRGWKKVKAQYCESGSGCVAVKENVCCPSDSPQPAAARYSACDVSIDFRIGAG